MKESILKNREVKASDDIISATLSNFWAIMENSRIPKGWLSLRLLGKFVYKEKLKLYLMPVIKILEKLWALTTHNYQNEYQFDN